MAFTFLFPFFYLFIPIYVAFGINVIVVCIGSFYVWKNGEKRLVIVSLLFLGVNAYFLIRYVASLQLLIVVDPVEIARIASLGMVISKFISYLPIFLLFLGAFAVLYVWCMTALRGASTYKFAIIIGYAGIIVMIVLIFLDMFTFTPSSADWIDEIFEIVVFSGVITIPFAIYYFIQISVWFITAFTFLITFLSHLVGGGGGD